MFPLHVHLSFRQIILCKLLKCTEFWSAKNTPMVMENFEQEAFFPKDSWLCDSLCHYYVEHIHQRKHMFQELILLLYSDVYLMNRLSCFLKAELKPSIGWLGLTQPWCSTITHPLSVSLPDILSYLSGLQQTLLPLLECCLPSDISMESGFRRAGRPREEAAVVVTLVVAEGHGWTLRGLVVRQPTESGNVWITRGNLSMLSTAQIIWHKMKEKLTNNG
jgi:hypothetical protein